jgi:antirestriction protein ArdC
VNVWLLGNTRFESPYWLTYKQAKDKGGYIRKGEKGTRIIKYGTYETQNEFTGAEETRMYLQNYTVFNANQTKDVPLPEPRKKPGLEEAVLRAEQAVRRMPNPPQVEHAKLHHPSYSRLEDLVRMPPESVFKPGRYHSTLFHELVHATGHESRLDRPHSFAEPKGKRREAYSFEELVAELGSAYLCAHTGLDVTQEQSASYIKGWADVLSKSGNTKWIIQASGNAQKAVDYILDEKRE